ncbi:hypothetical protein MY3296_002430 [Beauveria thailandica]
MALTTQHLFHLPGQSLLYAATLNSLFSAAFFACSGLVPGSLAANANVNAVFDENVSMSDL